MTADDEEMNTAERIRKLELRVAIMSRGVDELFQVKRQLCEARALLKFGKRFVRNCISEPRIDYDCRMPTGFQSRAEVWLADVDFMLSKDPDLTGQK